MLNAFRHQRKKRHDGGEYAGMRENMLNAFRHQRKKRCGRVRGCRLLVQCSTPSGIKGRNARRGKRRERAKEMLNAFRHQRKKRPSSPVPKPDYTRLCSTPSGIKGRNAPYPVIQSESRLVCSTPSGIKGRNADSQPESNDTIRHAQRLPASKEETREHPTRVILHRICSTPSGIKGRNAAGIRARESDWYRMLNAFRHQRKKRYPEFGNEHIVEHAQRLPASKEETPFARVASMLPIWYAQRLPASKEETRPIQHRRARAGGICSTPSGIKGRNA